MCLLSRSLTGVVAERVEDGDEVVQAGPVVRVAMQTLLEGVACQRETHQLHRHLTDLVPHVDVGGVQHHGLDERGKEREREWERERKRETERETETDSERESERQGEKERKKR